MGEKLCNKTLLIATNPDPGQDNSCYGDESIEEQISPLKDHFNGAYVILLRSLGVNKNLPNYECGNVKVVSPRFSYLSSEHFRKKLEDNLFRAALGTTKREGLGFDLIYGRFTMLKILRSSNLLGGTKCQREF